MELKHKPANLSNNSEHWVVEANRLQYIPEGDSFSFLVDLATPLAQKSKIQIFTFCLFGSFCTAILVEGYQCDLFVIGEM